MGMLSGFLGGMGKGLTESSKMAYDQRMLEDRDAKQYERQVQRDDVAATRQDVRDVRSHEQAIALKGVDLENRLAEAKQVIEINRGYEATDLAAAQEAISAAGGDFAKALPLAKTTRAAELIAKYQQLENDNLKTQSSIKTDGAQAASAYASAANSRDAISGRQQDRKTAAQERTDAARVRELQALIPRVKASGNTAALEAVQAEIISLSGVDPLATKGGNWKEVEETNQYGEKKVIGWRELDTGEFRPNTPAAAGSKPQKPFNPADFQRK